MATKAQMEKTIEGLSAEVDRLKDKAYKVDALNRKMQSLIEAAEVDDINKEKARTAVQTFLATKYPSGMYQEDEYPVRDEIYHFLQFLMGLLLS